MSYHANAEDGLAALKRARFDALILDVMLPDGDGFDVCRRVRVTSDIPILMLTARGDATDRIVGLELGACTPNSARSRISFKRPGRRFRRCARKSRA